MCGALKRGGGSELRRWVREDVEVGSEAVGSGLGEGSEAVWDELVGEGARWVLS